MRDIFQDLYNKVISFFNTQQTEPDPTKGVAMNRLKTVLMQDRVGFSERAIQMMKEELVHVVSKYMEIDDENFQLQIDADEGKTILNLSIPVTRPKTDEEIDASQKEQAEKTRMKAEEIVKELEGLIKERAMALVEGEIDPELIEQAAMKVEQAHPDEENKETQEDTDSINEDAKTEDTSDESEEKEDAKKEADEKNNKSETRNSAKHNKKKANRS